MPQGTTRRTGGTPWATVSPRETTEAYSLSVITTKQLLHRSLYRKNRKEWGDKPGIERVPAAVHTGSCGLRPFVLRSRNSGLATAPTFLGFRHLSAGSGAGCGGPDGCQPGPANWLRPCPSQVSAPRTLPLIMQSLVGFGFPHAHNRPTAVFY